MDTAGYGQHLIIEHQRKLRRAEARERLSLEEQAARGVLDDRPVRMGPGRRRGYVQLWQACAGAVSRSWGGTT